MSSALVPKFFDWIFENSTQIWNLNSYLDAVPKEFVLVPKYFHQNSIQSWIWIEFRSNSEANQAKFQYKFNWFHNFKPISAIEGEILWNCWKIQMSTKFQIFILFCEFWTNFRLWRFRVFLRKSNPTILLCSQNNPPPLFLENSEIGKCPAKNYRWHANPR